MRLNPALWIELGDRAYMELVGWNWIEELDRA